MFLPTKNNYPSKKEQTIPTTKSNKKIIVNKHRSTITSDIETSKRGKQHFKTIQKGVESILNSDILLNNEENIQQEDRIKDKSDHERNYCEEDEDSKDSIQVELPKEQSLGGASRTKKAKALINCFRSVAVKHT